MKEPEPLEQVQRTYVLSGRRKLSYFSGCDYYRLSSHAKIHQALQTGVSRYGVNVAASRLTTGNHRLYSQLERAAARFFGAEEALLVPTGYLTNLVVGQALARAFSHALIDVRAHVALRDAARLLDCPMIEFRHRDPVSLAEAVQRCGPHAKLIVLTDGMFAHDGSVAPLAAYQEVLPRDAQLLVDDAHGAGVLGRTGCGTLQFAKVRRGHMIQTLTLSKAFGVYGGIILGTRRLRQQILDSSGLFVGSTPLPLPLASAALEALRLLGRDRSFKLRLDANASYVKHALRRNGFAVPEYPGPIVALAPDGPSAALTITRALFKAGIYPPYIHYPGAPVEGYFRFVISSEHNHSQLEQLLRVLTALPHRLFGTAGAGH